MTPLQRCSLEQTWLIKWSLIRATLWPALIGHSPRPGVLRRRDIRAHLVCVIAQLLANEHVIVINYDGRHRHGACAPSRRWPHRTALPLIYLTLQTTRVTDPSFIRELASFNINDVFTHRSEPTTDNNAQ